MKSKAKTYLQRLKLLDTKIDQLIQEKEDLKARAFGTGGMDYSKDHVQTTPEDRMPKMVAAYVDMEKKIDTLIDAFIDRKHEVIIKIQQLEDERFVKLLYKRYVEYKSFEQIAVEMGYSYDHICRLHGRALQDFERCHTMSD